MRNRFASTVSCTVRTNIFALLVLSGLTGTAFGHYEPFETTGTVISNNDGDTLKVRTPSGELLTVRLAGCDTPERGQAYWKAAKARLASLSRRGVTVGCYKADRYERHVCRVHTGDTDIGLELVRQGLAWHPVRYADEQTLDEQDAYQAAEKEAQEARRGLWAMDNPMPPWECRERRRRGQTCR